MKRAAFALAILLATPTLTSCVPDEAQDDPNLAALEASAQPAAAAADDAIPTLTFHADWTITQSAPLVGGGQVRLRYDWERLPGCRGDMYGRPGWGLIAFTNVDGVALTPYYQNLMVADDAGHAQPVEPVFTLPAVDHVADLAIWFQVSSRWGCVAFDSDYGQNFHFAFAPAGAPAAAPTVTFADDGSIGVTQAPQGLRAGRPVVLDYDLDRLPTCRQGYNGAATWEILAFYRFDGGAVSYAPVTQIASGSRLPAPLAVLPPPGARDLEVWFKNTDRAGCVAWDSAYGQNFHFPLH